MSEAENLQNLQQISSTVSERDLKIWENVAHSICIQKQTEKLKSEIARMKEATAEKKKQNKVLENQIAELDKTIDIQKGTLRLSRQSVIMQTTYRNSLLQDYAEFKKMYSETFDNYNDELKKYREIYENASQDFKELKAQRIELKKFEVKKMMLDAKVKSVESSQKQFRDIQEKMFHTTIVKFAQFYTLYHEKERTQRLVDEKKKEEQQLLKEHLRLAEAVKQKKIQYQKQISMRKPSFDNANVTHTSENKENTEPTIDKLQKFLNEEILPCSLTSINPIPRIITNQDNSKVRVLDDRIIKPPVSRPPVRKPNPEFRKKMENIMQATKKEVMSRNNSFQTGQIQRSAPHSQKSITSQQSVNTRSQTMTQGVQIKANSQQQAQVKGSLQLQLPQVMENLQQQSQIKANSQSQTSQLKANLQQQSPLKANLRQHNHLPQQQPRFGSQERKQRERGMKSSQEREAKLMTTPAEIVKSETSNQVGNSILKPIQGSVDNPDVNKFESVSKFFNPTKKTVTFQNVTRKEPEQGVKFQLFSMEEKKSEPATVVTNMDMFHKPFSFRNEEINKNESVMGTESTPEMDEETNVSFSMETGPTTFSTYGDTSEKRNEVTFETLETSFNRNFRKPPLNPTTNENPTTGFSLFGSQATANPFNFF